MNPRLLKGARIAFIIAGAVLAVSGVLALMAGDVVRLLTAFAGVLLARAALAWVGIAARAHEIIAQLEAELEEGRADAEGPLQGRGDLLAMCVGGPLDGAEVPLLTIDGHGPREMTLIGPGGVRYEATGVDHTAYRLEAKP